MNDKDKKKFNVALINSRVVYWYMKTWMVLLISIWIG